MAQVVEVAGEGGVEREYHITQGFFVTFRTQEEDISNAMTGLLANIDSVIR